MSSWLFSPPPPPPPLIKFDVLTVLTAVIIVLATVLGILVCRRRSSQAGGGSSAPATPSKKGASAKKKPSFPRGPLKILWGSQTGTAEGFGNELMREARRRGFNAKSIDLEEVEGSELTEEEAPVIFLMATHGEGEPTDNAVDFYHWANSGERDATELASLKFAVFSLGNTQYEQFGFMGKWAQSRLAELGATALCDLGLGNDDDDIRADFEAWTAQLWKALPGGDEAGADEGAAPEPSFECKFLGGNANGAANGSSAGGHSPLPWLARAFPKLTLYEVEVSTHRELTTDPSQDSGSVVHVEFGCQGRSAKAAAATLAYEGADDLGVCCDGGRELAARAAGLLGLSLDERFELKPLNGMSGVPSPLPTPCTVEEALRYFADLRAPVSKQMLLLVAAHASDATQAAKLKHLASADGKAEYKAFIERDGRGLAELLSDFPSARPPLGALLEVVQKLAPRYYTISSSPVAANGTVHLTVKVLREKMRGAESRMKEGVCSTQLGGLGQASTAVVFVRASAFRLPRSPTTPVIMIGPGTGVAPFRAFAQQLQAETAAAGKPRAGAVRLYFGCRRKAVDFLYREELEAAERSGALTALRTAFSREAGQPKVYVQQRLQEDAAELYTLMAQQRAHVYICGATVMGREVVALLAQMHVEQGGLSEAEAAATIKQMTTDGRLVQELWS